MEPMVPLWKVLLLVAFGELTGLVVGLALGLHLAGKELRKVNNADR
jgi:hypothetical protein